MSFETLAGDLHLIERLRGRQARRRAPVGPFHRRPSRALEIGKADRRPRRVAALVAAFRIGALLGLLDRLGRENAVAEREPALNRHVHQRPRRLAGDDLEMKGLAANDAAERDGAVIRPTRRLGRVESDRHPGRNLQRAGHADEIVGRAGGLERAGRAGEKVGADRLVVARLDDEEAAALEARQQVAAARRGSAIGRIS